MASLNTSTNGPSISKAYQAIVNAPPPSGPAASSPTYGQWAVFSVSAPLANAFQQDSGSKESVLKVQSTGEGELLDLIDEFSDGRIQFALVKVKDSNTGLPKCALVAWCGEGVPERTKGYFTSHMNTTAKLLHGYHVQITARSDRDLSPEGIIQKVADASGSKYSTSSSAPPPVAAATKPTVSSKPVFTPTQSSGATGGYNPLARNVPKKDTNVDEDGWGTDAPPVTRTQLERVQPAYQPTKVNMRDLTSQTSAASTSSSGQADDRPGVVRGAYQPIGKVDIAAIRRQAQESGQTRDDRPDIVKGSYEPVGKVDIAAIRAKSQKPDDSSRSSRPAPVSSPSTGPSEEPERPRPLAERSAAFSQGPERLTSLPKPKVANKFGGGSSFTGTKAPVPGGFEAKSSAPAAPVGSASRTFADQGGKTPAQLWAEKKARERGMSGSGEPPLSPSGQAPITSQKSGDGGWKSGYAGKSWAPVQTTHTGRSSLGQQVTGESTSRAQEEEAPSSPSGGIGSLRDRFSGAPPMGAPATFDRAPPPAPEPETSNKPNRGIPIPGLPVSQAEFEEESAHALPTPPAVPRSPTPPTPDTREASPIRVAMPVSASAAPEVADAHDEQLSPPPAMPAASIARAMPPPADEDDEPAHEPDFGRAAAQAEAAATMGHEAVESAPAAVPGAERARAEYDYEAAEDNEVSLREGEIVSDIQRIDPDWWLVKNQAGQEGLVPSNYLTLLDNDDDDQAAASSPAAEAPPQAPRPAASQGATATALYDYEAAEDNELSFPENAIISNVTFPDEDWWHGEYNGDSGLFPANYTKVNE
ncbi:actin binding protein [Exophiala xenobiotica]